MAIHPISQSSAGVTIKTAPHEANVLPSRYGEPITDAETLLKRSYQKESREYKTLLQSSFGPQLRQPESTPLYASSNGFVKGAIDAYNQHYHFIIRPEDIWFAILTQFSCYVNAHAEKLRDKFVAHEGKRELLIKMVGTRHTVDFGVFAEKMGELLEENVVDKEIREWILPSFSTTTRDDGVVASILMMGTLQEYFSYTCCLMCGIPTVTLLGVEGDWENISSRLEKLKTYGEEPTLWYNLLKPVLARFVKSFREPDSDEVRSFWQRIAHEQHLGSGMTCLSGWITAFCFWTADGRLLYRHPGPKTHRHETLDTPVRPSHRNPTEEQKSKAAEKDEEETYHATWSRLRHPYLEFDGVVYHTIDISSIPPGYGSVPVKVDDHGDVFETTMVAGSVAVEGSRSGKLLVEGGDGGGGGDGGEVRLDTLRPVSGWWMFEREG